MASTKLTVSDHIATFDTLQVPGTVFIKLISSSAASFTVGDARM